MTLSNILSDLDVDHILFERHASTSYLPKAHYLNQRTMEIYRQHGMADEIITQAGTTRHISRVQWSSSLGGDDAFDRRHLGHVDAFGGGEDSEQAMMYK